jgi:photosystem II stability/assembly factor-like uncharacterized protein
MKKIILIFIAHFAINNSINSQLYENWAARYNGSANSSDVLSDFVLDGSGRMYLTGQLFNLQTNADYGTVKYLKGQYVEWERSYDGGFIYGYKTDYSNAIAVDGQLNVYVAGGSMNSSGYKDFVIVKYNSSGVQQWAVRQGGQCGFSGDDEAVSLVLDESRNALYVTGPAMRGGCLDYDWMTLKIFMSTGQVASYPWPKYHNGPASWDDMPCKVRIDNGGNIYIAGSSYGTSSLSDILFMKYDPNGNPSIAPVYNGGANGWDFVTDMTLDDNGNIYLTGRSEDYELPGEPSASFALITLKYNPSGLLQWAKRYFGTGTPRDAIGTSIKIFNNNEIYVTGYASMSGNNYDFVTIKYSSAGAELWVRLYNGPGDNMDKAYDITVDGTGDIYVTGESISTFFDAATIIYSSSGSQLQELRYDGTASYNDKGSVIDVYGNPHSGGALYVTGTSFGIGTAEDYVLIKYSENWQEPPGGDIAGDDFNALYTNASGNIFAASNNGRVMRSGDSGLSWQYFTTPVNDNMKSIKFTDENTGYIAGDNGKILKTIDGGNSWSVQQSNIQNNLNSIHFINSNTGFIVGENGKLLFTTNSGINWNIRSINSLQKLNKVCFKDNNTGFILTDNGFIIKTINSGQTWSLINIISGIELNDIFFCNENIGYMCGSSGKIFKSINSGLSWYALTTGSIANLNSLFFFDGNLGYAAGNSGLILVTTNGGLNWHQQLTETSDNLKALCFINRNTGIAVGENGATQLTTIGTIYNHGGDNSNSPLTNKELINSPHKFTLGQNYPNPFNPITYISYEIPKTLNVILKIFDITGKEVITLVNNETKKAGRYDIEWNAANYSSGVYIYRLEAGNYSETKKMVLIK